MKRLLLPALFLPGLFAGCRKCELKETVTLYVDFSGFNTSVSQVSGSTMLDNYDTLRMRQALLSGYDFLSDEVMVRPVDSSRARYWLRIMRIEAQETYTEETRQENCYDYSAGWLWQTLCPPETYRFYLEGFYTLLVAELKDRQTGETKIYYKSLGAAEYTTTSPPPGADTTGNPCFEWREEPVEMNGLSKPDYTDLVVRSTAHLLFLDFKEDICRSQNE